MLLHTHIPLEFWPILVAPPPPITILLDTVITLREPVVHPYVQLWVKAETTRLSVRVSAGFCVCVWRWGATQPPLPSVCGWDRIWRTSSQTITNASASGRSSFGSSAHV